jgi:serine/threonine protein kinase
MSARKIGKFELGRVLGKGAAGTVYLALDTFSGQEVALKVLHPETVSAPGFNKVITRQFMNEAALAGKLSHPHIAAILEASVDETSGYVAIEYVPGGNLTQFLATDKLLSVEDAIQVAFKACGALDYAFRQGIVHRDIKPANIMVETGTDIKVTDFGAAYLHQQTEGQIADIGTPRYMSPEQIQRRPLGQHSDMYSLGVVLYELFTGHRAFTAPAVPELFRKILNDNAVPPSERRAGLSKEIDSIVLRMMKKDPNERYPSWADLALEIANIGRLSVYQKGIADSEKFYALRRVPTLKPLGDAEIWELVSSGSWKRMPGRSVILREGERGSSLYFLGAGEVKVTKQGRLINVLSAGEYFGEMAYIKAGLIPRQTTVEAITDVLLAEFEPAALNSVSRICQLQLMVALLHALADRLAFADERLAREISAS